MKFSPELAALAHYLAGEFDNQEQALAEPVWYPHLRLWQRPVPHLFPEAGITLFAEQANVFQLDRPYRPRILRLLQSSANITIHYYMPKDIEAVRGGGKNPALLHLLTPNQLEPLPSCTLMVTHQQRSSGSYEFQAILPPEARCCFTYQGETRYVSLGFVATFEEFLSYDKGIDPTTGRAIWGAILGPFRLIKRQDFALELS